MVRRRQVVSWGVVVIEIVIIIIVSVVVGTIVPCIRIVVGIVGIVAECKETKMNVSYYEEKHQQNLIIKELFSLC